MGFNLYTMEGVVMVVRVRVVRVSPHYSPPFLPKKQLKRFQKKPHAKDSK
jgi:hypothetical protein